MGQSDLTPPHLELLDSWSRPLNAQRVWFTNEEFRNIETRRQSIELDEATIAYCVYENPFARSGGIFAVSDRYSQTLKARGQKSVVISPYHDKLQSAPNVEQVDLLGSCTVWFAGGPIDVQLYEHMRDGVRWILFRAVGFFNAEGTDPYAHRDAARLVTDSLFASAAIPEVLIKLGLKKNVILHCQDWELAATALTMKRALARGDMESAAIVLTTHNPYDQGLAYNLLRMLTYPQHMAEIRDGTVYQLMIPLTDAPVSTVSKTFASELTTDSLQTTHFAGHLQDVFRSHGLVGVDNGLFGTLGSTFRKRAITDAAKGKFEPILKAKKTLRKKMLKVLSEYEDGRIIGKLTGENGRSLKTLPDEVPVFFMFGRLDPGQKGFDVLCRAIESLPPGQARFVMAPIVGNAPAAFRDDFERLARSRPGDVAIYPFRMQAGYMETMAGATFGVMPSIYEPFGAATEPYLAGTPVVARKTGGLIQQVTDIDESLSEGTGITYREQPCRSDREWRELMSCTDPYSRMYTPVYGSMVASLAVALTRATMVYRSEPEKYARMLTQLNVKCEQFSWDRVSEEYGRLYQIAVGK